jgi:hypothetical protein
MPFSSVDPPCSVGALNSSNGFTGPREFVPLKGRKVGFATEDGDSDVSKGILYSMGGLNCESIVIDGTSVPMGLALDIVDEYDGGGEVLISFMESPAGVSICCWFAMALRTTVAVADMEWAVCGN